MALRLLTALLALASAARATQPPSHVDLTRTVPLDTGEVRLPEVYARALDAFNDLQRYQQGGNLFVIMEITRRAQQGLDADQARRFLELVKGQYQKQFDSPLYYFEQGYAQYVMRRNPTGLLLMRAADRRLESPVTALAVAMAQSELAGSRPVESTARFEEAWRRHARAPAPGFARSFGRVIDQLALVPGYREGLLAMANNVYLGPEPPANRAPATEAATEPAR